MKTQPQRLLEAVLGIEPHDQHIFEEREARRDAWDEAEEHRRDLEHESRVCEEQEASGYWDNYPEEAE